MSGQPWRRLAMAALAATLVAACGSATGQELSLARSPEPTATTAATSSTTVLPHSTSSSVVPPTTVAAPTSTAPPAPSPTMAAAPTTTSPPPLPPSPPPPAPSLPRLVHDQPWTPFATVGGVTLHHPSARVERVAFHESNHDGARPLEPLPTAADAVTLESRERGTSGRTAADVVVDPNVEIRSPVTGRVLRAGTYVLYCDYSDDYLVVEPDARPGWEVKVLHIDGVMVGAGDRVAAGETVVAPRPTRLPFESQVDEVTASPAWPHVHLEVVDPSIPDRPSGGC